ncbi:MAG TPA: hypothetical protein VGA30_07085, partial [Actinomycetota bacterium]
EAEPTADLWDRVLEGPTRSVSAPGRRQRLGAAAIALVAVAVGGYLAWAAFGPSHVAPEAGGWRRHTDRQGGWTISYPARMRLTTFESNEGVSTRGISIANFPAAGGGSSDRLRFLRNFPSSGVLLQLWQTWGGPMRIPQARDTRFPLSLARLVIGPTYVGGAEPKPHYLSLVANGDLYRIAVWIGPAAPTADREAAAAMVASLRFLPLAEGTIIGQSPSFYVLGPPSRYPVGSVTRFEASVLPRSSYGPPLVFDLIHVNGGFYALAWPDDLHGGYKAACGVHYEAGAHEFSCDNGARWALDGSVLVNPNPSVYQNDRLAVLLVRISLDGHVLVSPNVFGADLGVDLTVTAGS